MTGSGPALRTGAARCAPLLAAVAMVAAACGKEEESYFPLAEGWTWSYRVTTGTKGAGMTAYRSVVTNLPPQPVGGAEAVPRLFHDGRMHYYAAQPEGVRRIASRARGGDRVAAPPGDYLLKAPVEAGRSWRVETRTYLLRKHTLFDSMAAISARLAMDLTIEKVDDVVSVPAGTFRNVVRVRGRGETQIDLGPEIGSADIVIETVEWFAPGVGVVKMVRSESSHAENPGNARMIRELLWIRRAGLLD